eukprot:scaffold14206_cov95-Skeletonema_marinoi.AAC.4
MHDFIAAAPSQKRSVQHELLLLALLPLIDRASRRLRRVNILSDRLGNLAATTFLLGRLQLGLQSYTHIHIHIPTLHLHDARTRSRVRVSLIRLPHLAKQIVKHSFRM